MPYVLPEEIQTARHVDLLTYLRLREPGELVRVSGNTYTTKEHDSLKISNGKWYWFSKGIGGVSALDYLIKVRGYTFLRAVEAVLGKPAAARSPLSEQRNPGPRRLLLPEKNPTDDRVSWYLRNRGINPEIIRYCLFHQILYESKEYRNAVFIGRDEQGEARYAAIRATVGNYKSEAAGSDKRYDEKIRLALSYINENLAGDLSVDTLADRVFLSRYHFMRLFKLQTGSTVHAYVRQKRLLYAARLIREGMPVQQAAAECGFNDYSVFHRAFRESFGFRPAELKK